MILPTRYARTRWKEEDAEAWVGQSFTFTSRMTYLAWVLEWKHELKTRIKEIHDLKAIRRDKTKDIAERNAANAARQVLRIECANLFLLRQMAKQKAAQQRDAMLVH